MSEDMVKRMYELSKKYEADKICIVTNHLKISGNLCKCEGDEKKKDEHILTLMDAKMWRLKDLCKHGETDCNCEDASFCALEWLHVNVAKIVAFSVVK